MGFRTFSEIVLGFFFYVKRNSQSFKSFEEKVESTVSNIKVSIRRQGVGEWSGSILTWVSDKPQVSELSTFTQSLSGGSVSLVLLLIYVGCH